MGTYASVYINGELLCCTSTDGSPSWLGECLESVRSDWRSILSTCKDYGVCFINPKYFFMNPEFVYDCFDEKVRKDFLREYPDGPTPTTLKNLHNLYRNNPKNDPWLIEDISELCFDELYGLPRFGFNSWVEGYHYNHIKDMVFVRYPMKNFPWVQVYEVKKEERYIEHGKLDEIRYDMCGFLGEDDWDSEIF